MKLLSENELFEGLARLGAPLPVPHKTNKVFNLEETLAYSLKLARRNSTVARVLTVAFAQSKNTLDFGHLKSCALKLHETQALGFYLDLTGQLLHDRTFQRQAMQLFDPTNIRQKSFFVGTPKKGKYLRLLEKLNTPTLAKKWGFRMNLGMDSFEAQFKKHQ